MQCSLIKTYRCLSTSTKLSKKVIPSRLKGKSVSSQQWLTRQLNDPYVEKAKLMNYRCRSAFKLLEIDDRFKFLKPGCVVVDCGAAPGSWTQVSVSRVCRGSTCEDEGVVIGIDKQYVHPIEGAVILGNSDFTLPEVQSRIHNILKDRETDVVLSDMAPNATGIKEVDNENMLKLCYSALRFAVQVSKVNATFLVKLWFCNEIKELERDIKLFYDEVKIVKPEASRDNSAEIFLLGTCFKGLIRNS